MLDELREMTRLSVLEAWVRTSGVDGLRARLREVSAQLPADVRVTLAEGLEVGARTLRILETALSLDADFLHAHPEALFQCLYNRLRWFDAPDAAPFFVPESQGPWLRPDAHLYHLAHHWRREQDARAHPAWLENLRPLAGELEGPEYRFQGLPGEVHSVAFSPSGEWLATGSYGGAGNVCLWNVATGERTREFEGHPDIEVLALDWSPDGQRLASGSRSHDARVWDVATGEMLADFRGQEGRVTSVAWSPDGRRVAAGNLGWMARLFDVATGEVVREFQGHEQSVLTVSFHPSGRWLATGASDSTARVWDVETGAEVAQLECAGAVESVAFSPDGRWLALADGETLDLVETQGWTRERTLLEDTRAGGLQWLGGQRLGLASFDSVEVLDVEGGARVTTSIPEGDGQERFVAFHPDGVRFARSAAGGRLRLQEVGAPFEVPPRLSREWLPVFDMWAPDGHSFALVRAGRGLALVEADGRIHELPQDPFIAPGFNWAVDQTETVLAYTVMRYSDTGETCGVGVGLLDRRTGAPLRHLGDGDNAHWVSDDARPYENLVALSPDGAWVAATVALGVVRLWDARTEEETSRLLHFPEAAMALTGLSFTPDGTHLRVSSRQNKRLALYEVTRGALVLDTEASQTKLRLAFAAAERAPQVAVGKDSGAVELFHLQTAERRRVEVTPEQVWRVALSPDGALLAAACSDGVLRLLDTRSGTLVRELFLSELPISVELGEDLLIVRTRDDHTRIYERSTGTLRLDFVGQCSSEYGVVHGEFWGAYVQGPFQVYPPGALAPQAFFPDGMQSTYFLPGGLLVAKGMNDSEAWYLLRFHPDKA